ncbi:winged helix-turn-helix domain-containing protein [Paenibacillus thiaminolyticus]|uniref:ArsR/SmtB family transcription factor n=1 Tax=Paenibacillus thiaminolyticus TaxID=49283 RepID=UPI00235100ED|nr:winged helix-turn-helix domain-containing protein [Paenibacillus thiaminolyticus]MDG0874737.1 winged helix-turn-helix domain-containing protein [Paenibacillus thiaminolyticus]WCR27347.1 winged helix-turn-helix domain-containing protein [Paenibacillus thiaminolyticus]
MKNHRIISDLELAKALLDSRRTQILRLAREEPVTVKQLAERLDEKPSRLYYHVKKLEELDLLQLVETKQHGNLIEKYYQTNPMQRSYTFDRELAAENSAFIVQELSRLFQEGIGIIEEQIQTERHGEKMLAEANIAYRRMTPVEWGHKMALIQGAVTAENGSGTVEPDEQEDMGPYADQTEEDDYVFVTLSYRLKDVRSPKP